MTRDRLLVRRMLAGDERAFDEFFDDSFPRLYRFAVVRLGNDADAAEDVVQATICKAIGKLHTYRGEAPLFTWLCTFCRHEISTHFRGGLIRLPEDDPEIAAALSSIAASDEAGPESTLRRDETARLVHVTLDALPFPYGEALEWKYIDELSVKEIADRLRVSPKAAESVLTRARIAFRDGFRGLTRLGSRWSRTASETP